MKRFFSALSSTVIIMLLFLMVSVCVNAATYESASFYSGTYMYGTITVSDPKGISGKTAISGDPGTVTVDVRGKAQNPTFPDLYKSAAGNQSKTVSVSGNYTLKEYLGNHIARIGSKTKTVATHYVRS